MKKLVYILICMLLGAVLFGCNQAPSENSSVGEVQSQESLEESSQPEESVIDYTEIFEFLNSEYTVSFKKTVSNIQYNQTYYFVDGVVAGAKVSATLGDEKSALEFHEYISKSNPYCEIDGKTISYYVDDDDDFYEGYSLEKLIFVLEKSGYNYELSFDKEEFNKEFGEEIKD